MSQRLDQKRSSPFAPELKRTFTDHKLLSKDPFAFSHQNNYTRQIAPSSKNSQMLFGSQPAEFEQGKERQNSLTNYPTQTSQQSFSSSEGIVKIQEKMNEAMDVDLAESIGSKERTNYGNRYQQKQNSEAIYVSQPKWIPQQIETQYNLCQSRLKAGEKVNFFQGFLSQLGFMYYAVERKVYFYDIENIREDTKCLQIIETEHKLIDIFHGIQVIDIGPPYLNTSRKVLVFFHFQQAELYNFSLAHNDSSNNRRLQIKYLNISFRLQQTQPSKLVKGSDGLLYYSDNKGNLKFIETDHSFLNKAISNISLSSKQITKHFRQFVQNTTKNITRNLICFSKAVYNFSKSLFSKGSIKTDIVADYDRNLIITYYCELLAKGRISHHLKVYRPDSQQLLYTLQPQDFLDKYSQNDWIVKLNVLQSKVNNNYNLALLLNSGKRVFLDLTDELLKKSIIYLPLPLNHIKYYSELSQSPFSIQSSVLEDRFYATLQYSDSTFTCSLVRPIRDSTEGKREAVIKLNVQIHGSPRQNQYYMFSRSLQELGPIKSCLLSSESKNVHPIKMNSQVCSVFYRPQELVHASDKMMQRVIMFRPVDILFTLANELNNIYQILNGIQLSLQNIKPKDLIGYCCQILLDEEGAYYISQQLVTNIKIKLTIRFDKLETRNRQEITEILSNSIAKETRSRIEEIIVELVKQQPQERQEHLIRGLLSYISKLFRPIWFTSINQLHSDACRYCLSTLQAIEQLLSKFKKRLRCSDEGVVKCTLDWVKRLWEVLFLSKTIPTLPEKLFSEVICWNPSELHEYIFNYLVKYCEPRMMEELRRSIPTYINSEFVQTFKLWISLEEMRSNQERIALCKQQSNLPSYLIGHLSKIKGLQNIANQFEGKRVPVDDINNYIASITSYKKIIHCLKEASDTLIAKEILLEKAKQRLKEEAKFDQVLLQEGLAEIAEIHSQIHLQRLLKQYYLQHKEGSQSLKSILTKVTKAEKSSQLTAEEQTELMFETELFDVDSLSSLIESTKEPLLDIAFANYYLPDQVITKVNDMITATIQKAYNFRELPVICRYQMEFLISKAKLGLSGEIFTKIYIRRLSEVQGIIELMNEDNGILEDYLFFPLCLLANISSDAQRLWRWTKKTINQLDKTSNFYKYLCACTTYFIKNYLPSKKQDFCDLLSKTGSSESVFAKMKAILCADQL